MPPALPSKAAPQALFTELSADRLLLAKGDVSTFLKKAVEARKTILLSGGTSSGKTTLLNYILKEQHGYKFAVIVNEMGKIGVDGALVRPEVTVQKQSRSR